MNNSEFLINLIKFYKESICGSISAIKELANLQKKYNDNYEIIKKMSLDPNALTELLDKLDDESKGVLIDIYFKQESLSKKMNQLLQMNFSQKEEFSKELEGFGKQIDEKINKLKNMKKHE